MAYGQSAVRQEGGKRILVIDLRGAPYGADIALYEQAMRDVVDKLMEVDADEVVLSEYYERIYDAEQTRWLKEVADVITRFEVDAVWSPSHIGKTTDSRLLAQRHDAILTILNTTHGDPFKAYLMLLREIKGEVAKLPALSPEAQEDEKVYLNTLQYMREHFEKLGLIQKMKAYLSQLGEIPAGRTIYHSFFEVAIKPSFIGSRIFFAGAEGLELVDQYEVMGSRVYIYKHPDKVEFLYFINPPEYALPPEKYFLLEKTKEVVAAHRPEHVEFMNIAQARKYFKKIYVATIADLALKNRIELSVEEKEELATIVSRYTIGYGILELFLSDRQLTDVYIDSPLGEKPVYVVHSKYGQCQSNVIFSEEEARSVVSRFRALSGRPFDEAHPILDFDLPDLQTRIAVIGKPLALDGIAFALRLHKDTPWTLPQFVNVKMFDAFTAGMLSYYVDAQASMLIVGSRGSGKTSMLQSMMLEIPQNLRIIVQEDSVTGDSEILVERNGSLEKTTVGKLIDGIIGKYGCENVNGTEVVRANLEGVKVFALDSRNKMRLQPVSQFIRHPVSKPIYEVTTRTGKSIKVTGDHSLFTLGVNGIEPIKTLDLKPGNYIATPRTLSFTPRTRKNEVNLLEPLQLPDSAYLVCEDYKHWAKANRRLLSQACKKFGFSKCTAQNWARKGVLPVKIVKLFPELLKFSNVRFKLEKTSKPIPAIISLTPEFLNFLGLWLSDGCYDGKYGVVISAGEPEEVRVIDSVASQFGLKSRVCTDEYSRIISNTGLVWICKEALGLVGNSFSKKIPEWVFGLSDDQIAELLKGVYSGDGHAARYEVTISLRSKRLIKDIQTLLLRFGVISRQQKPTKHGMLALSVSSIPMLRQFSLVGFLQERKNKKLAESLERTSTHDNADVVPLPRQTLESMVKTAENFNKYDYVSRGFKMGRRKLVELARTMQVGRIQEMLSNLAESDVYWDEVVSVKLISDGLEKEFVYDLSVPGCENFVCEDVIAHNTQEIPVPALKKLGFNIQRLKTRPPLGGISETEVSAEDALRTALRLGDSVLIVGEVRSLEAKALYEAMRIGAVGNVVMGTIHGESAYSIWDRVVNDLGVPTTSFKATDFAIVSAPIRFKGSLKRFRRLIEVTEVKKHWEKDPDKEGGLLQWMSFDASKDKLDFFEDVVLKESEWLQRVKRVRGLTTEQVFDEVRARGETKQYLVDVAKKLDLPQIMEAEYSVRAHNKYVLMADAMRAEIGGIEYPELLKNWRAWVDETLARDAQAVLAGKKPLA